MKHKYVLYAMAVLLVLNTGLYCMYAVKQSSLMNSVNDFIETTNARLDKFETTLTQTVQKEAYDEAASGIAARLSTIEDGSKQEFEALHTELNGLAKSRHLDALSERISNLEKVYIQLQVSLNELQSQAKPDRQFIKSATP